jgi:hypothetical protein
VGVSCACDSSDDAIMMATNIFIRPKNIADLPARSLIGRNDWSFFAWHTLRSSTSLPSLWN